MSAETTTLLVLLVALLLALMVSMRLRRRAVAGKATEIERRFDRALRRFKVEFDLFKFAPQSAVKILLNHDHVIGTKIDEISIETGEPRERLRLRVHRYLEEIVPFFKPLAYYKIGYLLAHTTLNLLYKIDYDPEQVERVKKLLREKPRTVIYLLNHRSNVDFVIAPYVLKDNIALSFAVGEWARVWPLEFIFKSFGSYFIRRGFRDPLYHTVLRRYVQLVTKNAVTQALFPEGGLSRDGLLRAPKIGLVDYILCSKEDRSFTRDLIIVPVGLNYDRVLEDRVLVGELSENKEQKSKTDMGGRVLRILFGNLSKFWKREIRKNGMAVVRFGEPVSFDDWHARQPVDMFSLPPPGRRREVVRFCNDMMERIASVIPVTPLCLVAKALVETAPTTRTSLEEAVQLEIEYLTAKGIDIVAKERGVVWMVEGALLRFGLRRLIEEVDGLYHIVPHEELIVRYYANAIIHHYTGEIAHVEVPEYVAPDTPGST